MFDLRQLKGLILLGSFVIVAPGCTTPDDDGEPLEGEDLERVMSWDDLVASPGENAVEALTSEVDDDQASTLGVGDGVRIASNAPIDSESHAVIVNARRERLPVGLRRNARLASLAVSRSLENPIAYEGGVFGLQGATKVFITTPDLVPTDSRLYWVMVKVLSEKYGCFMTSKQAWRSVTKVTCRDRRQVVFWTQRGPGAVAFHARQFDREGYEIVVRQRQIVRISTQRIL